MANRIAQSIRKRNPMVRIRSKMKVRQQHIKRMGVKAERELVGIFLGVEKQLFAERDLLGSLDTKGGKLVNDLANLARIDALIVQIDEMLERNLRTRAKDEWAAKWAPNFFREGRALAKINFSHNLIDQRSVLNAFSLVSEAEKGILRVGYKDTYDILNTVGDDIGTWFRREMTRATIEGIPLVDKLDPKADTLMSRLYKSGRLKPQTIKTASGAVITRTLEQRAEGIARIESMKIINRTHEQLCQEILGEDGVYINANPTDDRTTDICERATAAGPMTLAEWDASEFGRPPRMDPFHYCRSVLIGGRKEWFD